VSESFVFSKTLPLYSVVNPNVPSVDYLDRESPYTFFDFLKYTKADLSPAQFNNLYVDYIKEWNKFKNKNEKESNQSIQDRYIDLIKQITVKYTTLEEKRFLSNIDYNDITDLDIVLPFYSKKIKEICKFYSDKREKLKFKIQKNKIKGTSTSIEKSIIESITDVLFSDIVETSTYQKTISQEDLVNNLGIEIEELYDIYTSYLDNNPKESYDTYDVKTELRKTLYSANINKIDANIFIEIDQAITDQLFENIRVFLVEFGKNFTINYNLNAVDLNCKPDAKLYNLVSQNKPKATRLVDLRNALIRKYIGSDFYYIKTGSTISDITEGLLFKADNPTGNLLNRNFPTTASIEEESDLQSARRIGLFFTPDKNSILYYSVPEKKYKIDNTKLEPDKLYIYPDPERYGNTIGLSRTFNEEYPLIHICDYTNSIRGHSYNDISGDINNTPYNQDYYSYFSRNQLSDNYITGKDGLNTNLASLYNKGVMTKWSSDVYGNQYGLFKYRPKKQLIDNSIVIEKIVKECEEYDGGPITFYENGFLPEEVFASNGAWVKPNIWASDYYYNILLEGGIGKIINGIMERGIFNTGVFVDGLDINRTSIPDSMFDLNINPLSANQYTTIDGQVILNTGISYTWDLNVTNNSYTTPAVYNIDGNFYDRHPKNNLKVRPINTIDGNSVGSVSNAVPSFNRDYILSSIKFKEFDGGFIEDFCETDFNFEEQSKFVIQQTLTSSRTILNDVNPDEKMINPYELKNSYGNIYIKNITTGNVSVLSSGLQQFIKYNIYNSTIQYELYNKVLDFNIYNNFLWIRTKEYIIFEKITYDNSGFTDSGTGLNYIRYKRGDNLSNITNPFIFESRDYAMVVMLTSINTNSNLFSIIPIFYKIDYTTTKIEKIQNLAPSTIYQNISSINPVKLSKINQPVLTYNTRNDKYCIMTTIEDPNGFSYIYQIKFKYDGAEILDIKIKMYNFNIQKIKTINFYDINSLYDAKITENDITGDSLIDFNKLEGTLILS